MEESIYSISPVDKSYEFEQRVLITSPLEEYGVNYNIVRCSFDDEIVVSEKFKKVIRANKLNCMSFAKELEIDY